MHVAQKFTTWVALVELKGVETVRLIPGFHDEALKGQRKEQRSIRLNRSYRAIYEVRDNRTAQFIRVEEVNKHEY